MRINRALWPPAWLITLAVLTFSLLFVMSSGNLKNCVKLDSTGYLKLSDNLRHYHVFSSDTASPYSPELFRLPIYPLFLAASNATSTSTIRMALGLQCFLGIVLVFMVWPLFYRTGGNIGGILGTLFLCFDLVAVLHQPLIMTEPLFTFILTGTLFFSVLYLQTPNLRNAALAGIAFGLLSLIKPIALFVAGAFLCSSFKKWKSTLWLAVFTLALPTSWLIRNRLVTGHLAYTVQGGLALFEYPAAGALAIDTGRLRSETAAQLEEALMKSGQLNGKDPFEQSQIYQRESLEIMEHHLSATLKYCWVGVIRILGGTGLEMVLDLMNHPRPVAAQDVSDTRITASGTVKLMRENHVLIFIELTYLMFLAAGYILFCIGAWKLFLQDQKRLAFFIVFSVSIILLISCHQGYYRFRIPLLPFLALGISASFRSPQREL